MEERSMRNYSMLYEEYHSSGKGFYKKISSSRSSRLPSWNNTLKKTCRLSINNSACEVEGHGKEPPARKRYSQKQNDLHRNSAAWEKKQLEKFDKLYNNNAIGAEERPVAGGWPIQKQHYQRRKGIRRRSMIFATAVLLAWKKVQKEEYDIYRKARPAWKKDPQKRNGPCAYFLCSTSEPAEERRQGADRHERSVVQNP
ncbi:hypothetical protein NA57DRAFT_59447 [Rhizodiscina lignyota]|uniref:Uncharacterized protein n=1 Tax=Rhizodiscina lignyota TaxID=1504668 RepID=A0A9P4I9N4_9PEZI|nr:hypothetical protein NA57DRAFT_59447 [Rhizodiscina lignyota]